MTYKFIINERSLKYLFLHDAILLGDFLLYLGVVNVQKR